MSARAWKSDLDSRSIARGMRRLASWRASARRAGLASYALRLSGLLAELAPALAAAKARERMTAEQTAET